MRFPGILLALAGLGFLPAARGTQLYSNTTTDTLDTFLYSFGPYTALGDQIQLVSSGTATSAGVEFYNNGSGGTFDAELDFFTVGSPAVGSLLGNSYLTGNTTLGGDVLDLTFSLGAGLVLPQNVVFAITLSNVTPGIDLGVDMFEPPTVGASDNSFMIGEMNSTYQQIPTNSENVYFELDGTADSAAAPEPSSVILMGVGLVVMGWGAARKRGC